MDFKRGDLFILPAIKKGSTTMLFTTSGFAVALAIQDQTL